jgi:hypothetical protein
VAALKISKRTVDAAPVTSCDRRLLLGYDPQGLWAARDSSWRAVLRHPVPSEGPPCPTFDASVHGSPWTADAARSEAERLLIDVKKGVDPVEVAKRKVREARTLSFPSYVERFVERCLQEEWTDSWPRRSGRLLCHVTPHLRTKGAHGDYLGGPPAVVEPIRARKALARKVWAIVSRLFSGSRAAGHYGRRQSHG